MKKSLWGVVLAAILGFGVAGSNQVHAMSAINTQAMQSTAVKVQTRRTGFSVKTGYRSGVGRPEGIVIHETAEPSWTATSGATHFANEWKSKKTYVHALVDAGAVINIANNDYQTWGAGAVANHRFINIELCETTNSAAFAKSINNLAYYTATLLRQYNLKPDLASGDGFGTIWSHYDVTRFLGGTDHTDPVGYFATHGYDMNQFYELVSAWYSRLGNVKAQASAKNANVIRLGDATGLYAGPGYGWPRLRVLKAKSAWRYNRVQVTRGQYWFNLGGNQWVHVGGLTKPVATVTSATALRSGPGAGYKWLRQLNKGARYKYGNVKLVAGTFWYNVGTNQWFANGVGKTTVTGNVIHLGKQYTMVNAPSSKAGRIRMLPAGSNWKFTKTVKAEGKTWYCLGGNQWIVN